MRADRADPDGMLGGRGRCRPTCKVGAGGWCGRILGTTMARMGIVLLTLVVLVLLAAVIGRWMPFMRLRAVVSRLARYIGWGGLLLPVVLMCGELWGMNSWAIAATLSAAVIVVLLPAVAADLAASALTLFGLYGMVIGAFWPSMAAPVRFWSGPLYGTINVDSRWDAIVAGLEGLALAGFGLWLVPRTLSRHRWVALALRQGQEWLEQRGFRPAARPDRGGPDQAGRDGAGRDGAGRDQAGRDGAGLDGAGLDGTVRDGTVRDGTGRDGTGRDWAGRDWAGRDRAAPERAERDRAGRDRAAAGDDPRTLRPGPAAGSWTASAGGPRCCPRR